MPTSTRLADLAGARQRQVDRRADRAVAAAERAVRRSWLAVLALLREPRDLLHRAQVILQALPGEVRAAVALELIGTVRWGHRATRANLAKALPRRALVGLLRRATHGRVAPGDAGRGGEVPGLDAALHPGAGPEGSGGALREDLDWLDLFSPGGSGGGLLSLLFPAPDANLTHEVVYASGWQDRIRSGTGLGDPLHLAQRIATGLTLGHTHGRIARDILPAVQRVQSSARRVARTESLRVAGAVQMRCHRQLGDLVVGWTVHATLDANTRPEHRARDGTTYWVHPEPGQVGTDQMPHPPQEADGSMAWNCRCYLTPRLRD